MKRPFIIPAREKLKIRKLVLSALGHGAQAARTGNDLARVCGYRDDRYVRVMIRELIAEGVPIASSVSERMGFFIVQNEHEAAAYIRILKARIREDENRLRDFEAAVASYSLPEQLAFV